MKTVLLSFCLFLLIMNSYSQVYQKNDKVISIGIQVASLMDDGTKYQFIPINASFENIFIDKKALNKLALGAGIESGYFIYTLENNDYQVFDESLYLSLHYSFTPHLETYLGLMVGYYFDSYNNEIAGVGGYGGLNSKAFLGVRYFVTPKLGIYTRILTTSLATECGISYKL